MKCKSCGGVIERGDTECGDCGAPVKTRRVYMKHEKPHCSFHDGDRYCPAPGAWNPGGVWFCYWHGQTDNFQTNRLILDDLLANGVRKVKDWRDTMVELVMRGVSADEARKQMRNLRSG